MMEPRFTVFSYRRCPFAMRVRIALHEKGIPFEIKEEKLNHFSQELKDLHPEAKVPLLIHGERVVYESAIIAEYIDDLAPERVPLMPKDAGERSEVRLWTYWCNHHFKPQLDRFKYGSSRFKEEECIGAEEKVKASLVKIENRLLTSTWLVGQEFSLADINVFPFVRQLFRIQPTPTFLEEFPKISQWYFRISERPSVVQTLKK